MKMLKSRTNKQNGQATLEWTIATFALVVALFVPWNGNDSAVSAFMKAVRINHANSSFVLSLP